MNPWRRKAWSTRVRRWLKMMPADQLKGNPWEKGTRTRVKEWVKDNVNRRGEDSILWGRWKLNTEASDEDEDSGTHTPKDRDPPTSKKQMRKLGEPLRKVQRLTMDQDHGEEAKEESGEERPCSKNETESRSPRQEETASQRRRRKEQNREKGNKRQRHGKKRRQRR